jgi:hypothetical protein
MKQRCTEMIAMYNNTSPHSNFLLVHLTHVKHKHLVRVPSQTRCRITTIYTVFFTVLRKLHSPILQSNYLITKHNLS